MSSESEEVIKIYAENMVRGYPKILTEHQENVFEEMLERLCRLGVVHDPNMLRAKFQRNNT